MENTQELSSKEKLYKLMYFALLGIREEAYDINNKRIYRLSNFVHNLPLQLLKLQEESDYDDLLEEVEKDALAIGLKDWINQILKKE